MDRRKRYNNTKFPIHVIRAATNALKSDINSKDKANLTLRLEKDNDSWSYDSEEDFFSDYNNGKFNTVIYRFKPSMERSLEILGIDENQIIEVEAKDKTKIQEIFNIFEEKLSDYKLPPKKREKPVVFIGHGHSPLWRDLKDHLQDKHQYKIESYEIGSRAGHTIRDILDDMTLKSTLALLVLTAENETQDNKKIPRLNVIHETGLFQGKLGFNRAIVLLEEGVEEFSNLHGIQQIRFDKGKIKETFGDVLATIKREFPNS